MYKYRIPKFPGKPGEMFSRAHFLDGSMKAYYGPGQRPDAGEPGLYVPPTDWPRPGQILRVPQVAWLTVAVPYPYQPPGSGRFLLSIAPQVLTQWTASTGRGLKSIWDGTLVPSTYNGAVVTNLTVEGQVTSDGAVQLTAVLTAGGSDYNWETATVVAGSPPGGSGWYGGYQQSIANPFPDERARLLGTFADAKSKVEKLRPGTTFVNVVDPWAPYTNLPPPGNAFSPWTGYGNPSPPLPDGHGGFVHFGWQNVYFPDFPGYYWPSISPADADNYLGTDWLHVYCGTPATTEQIIQDPDSTFDLTPATLARGRSAPLIFQAARQRFARIGSRFFGLSLPLAQFPAPPPPPTVAVVPAPDTLIGALPDGTQVYFKVVPDPATPECQWAESPPPASNQTYVNNLYANIQSQVTAQNDSNRSIQAGLDQILDDDATNLSGAGVDAIYMGVTNLILDSDYLVDLIAAYYRFDKETGADL